MKWSSSCIFLAVSVDGFVWLITVAEVVMFTVFVVVMSEGVLQECRTELL
ncbi:hypothetical protein [Dermatophilus congolensis]|nr:hypothetical protein [Dermatophilus congolensis]MBO3128786.1 hypothetical protein [Dermatophilus congolensis]MBO3132578.1 hypothetical protein [Dermatophilus congolensis]MBO3133263.1 hypothetical protein [Dermatophilus congolensis]MBO3135497.1 hypothetical protein [Dermatophilus congolensis]MBO3137735.1 hypothetical protein [Dermatophilus congolensis]